MLVLSLYIVRFHVRVVSVISFFNGFPHYFTCHAVFRWNFQLFYFRSLIWTGLCRHKAPTKLTENPLAAG